MFLRTQMVRGWVFDWDRRALSPELLEMGGAPFCPSHLPGAVLEKEESRPAVAILA